MSRKTGHGDLAATLLGMKGLSPTPRRVAVLECLHASHAPMAAPDILSHVQESASINKATLYRILDLLVEHDLALRHSAGERSFRYCALAPAAAHDQAVHCHFHCTRCGAMQCLNGSRLLPDRRQLAREVKGHVSSVEIRLDGICEQCQGRPQIGLRP